MENDRGNLLIPADYKQKHCKCQMWNLAGHEISGDYNSSKNSKPEWYDSYIIISNICICLTSTMSD